MYRQLLCLKMSKEYQKAEECFQRSVTLRENKFQVDIPLTKDINELQIGDSFLVALLRFLSLKSLKGVSVNDVMLNGPFVQSELFDILLLWRTFYIYAYM